MSDRIEIRILGCGSSGGVPRLGGHWGACDPSNPKNHRKRCSILLTRQGDAGITRVLVDTSPDLRAQLLEADIGLLDAAVFTHAHADHVHGLDDLRMVVFNRRSRLPVRAAKETAAELKERFAYAFVQKAGSPYPPILDLDEIDGPFEIDGDGGPIPFQPFEVIHGKQHTLGFRIHDLVYMPDVSDLDEASWPHLLGLDCLIIDALRYTPHPTHLHLEKSLEWIERAAPKRAILTNLHIDLDHDVLAAETPDHVCPAYDGMTLEIRV